MRRRSIVMVVGALMSALVLVNVAAAQTGGTVVCWGAASWGECTVPAGLSGIRAIAAGNGYNWALKSDGTVVGPIVPAGLTGVTAIAAGTYQLLALKSDGTVVAWGGGSHGAATVPAGLTGVTAVAAGGELSLALKRDGTVIAWGDNTYGQTNVPTGLSGVTAIAAGDYHSLALKSDGTVVAWGRTDYCQDFVTFDLSGVTAIATGHGHSLALKSDGTVVAWGSNSYGQATVPAGLSGVTAISAGWSHSLALKSDGTVIAWGDNRYGEATVPAGLSGVTAISANWYTSLALTAPPNWAPIAQGVTVSTNENTPTPVSLSATDQDSSDTLTYFLVTPPQHGKLSLGTPGSYTPDRGYTGTDTFQYRAYDGKALSNVANGTITVVTYNYPPVARPDSATTAKGTKVTINVLANDSDPDGDPLTVVGITQGINGKVAINADNTLAYSPGQNFAGSDAFSYVISDGRGGTAMAAVTVTVTK